MNKKKYRPYWLLAVAAAILAVGCAAETIPAAEPNAQDLAPVNQAAADDAPTAEALQKILESELLEKPVQPATPTPLLEEVMQSQPLSSKMDAETMKQINHAKANLAQRLGVDESAVVVAAYEAVTWRDGALGCPQPGMMYTQALVDGYLIQLQVDGQSYNYHGARGREPFLCNNDAETTESSPAIERGGRPATPPGQEE